MKKKQPRRHKSIGDQMNRVRTYERQEEVLTTWKESWQADFDATVRMIERELRAGRIGAAMPLIHQLKAMNEKKFIGLNSVIKRVCDPERVLRVRDDKIPELASKPQPVTTEKIFWRKPIRQIREQKVFDIEEMVRAYNSGIGTKAIAVDHGISHGKVVKILVTAGVYSSEKYDLIRSLRERGLPEQEIADIAEIGIKGLNNYTPYARGFYGLSLQGRDVDLD